MPKWLKIVLILLGVGILGVGLLVGGIAWWVSANKDRLAEIGKNGQEEGTRFGATHSQSQCVDDGLSHLKDCGALDFMCEAGNKIRLVSCLDAATQDGTCNNVPSRNDIFRVATWANEQCTDKGFRGSQPCGRMMQALPEVCSRPR